MSTLFHTLFTYIWAVMAVVGFIFAALVWVGMALWDSVRRLFSRLSGEIAPERGDDREGRF